MKKLLVLLVLISMFSCKKQEDDATSFRADPYNCMYIGEYNLTIKSTGVHESDINQNTAGREDTAYIDTFWVEKVGIDSVKFTKGNTQWQFLIDSTNYYSSRGQTNGYTTTEFWLRNDSIIFNFTGDYQNYNAPYMHYTAVESSFIGEL